MVLLVLLPPVLMAELWGDSTDESADDHHLLARGDMELREEDAGQSAFVEMSLQSPMLFQKLRVRFAWDICERDPVV